MNPKHIFYKIPLVFVLIFGQFLLFSCSNERETTVLSRGWKFSKGMNETAFLSEFDDRNWENVVLPHDWAIEEDFEMEGDGNTGKLPWKGEAWYRTKLEIPSKYSTKKLYLLFDGIMSLPKVYVNGNLAGKWDYAYNSFYLDISHFVKAGQENNLAIHVDTRMHGSRWYPGAGIYRKIQLIAVNPIHVAIWGTQITTGVLNQEKADIKIATRLNNHSTSDAEITLKHRIYETGAKQFVEQEISGNIAKNTQEIFDLSIQIPNPKRWDIENPTIYQVETSVYRNKKQIDTYHSTFGLRTIRFTADSGFFLNGKRVQLKGANLHSDFGPLGTAFNLRAMERQLEIMKTMGCNAIRTSHNPPAPEMLDLCDKMGLLVFEEIFDKYDNKADILDTTNFEDFAERNIRNFIQRDRNHPSVFIWSVGNEIGDVQWNIDSGFYKLQTMLKFVKEFDPTRPTTLVCDSYESAQLRHFDFYDIHSWNYGRRYRLARELEPNKSVIISESASTLSTRGFYEFPLPEQKTDFTKSLQVSSYDFHAPEWAELADDDFMWQQQEPYIAGEFIWTGFDYLGEPAPYTNQWVKENGLTDKEASRSSYFGVVDLCGIPKDRYYLYKSYWEPEETTIHILPHWNWEGRIGKNVPVFVYTNGDCAELFLNGKSLGKKCKNPDSKISTERFRLMWKDVIYQPGELVAIAYKNNRKIGEQTMKTAGEPYQIKLSSDRTKLNANGEDLAYILIEALDKNGIACPLAENLIEIELKGAGKIAGVGNGNPQSFAPFKSDKVKLFYGKAMLIVRSEFAKGELNIEAISAGLKKASVQIELSPQRISVQSN